MDQNKIPVVAGTRQALQQPPLIYSDHLSPARKSEGFVLPLLGGGRAHFKAQTSSRKWEESLKILDTSNHSEKLHAGQSVYLKQGHLKERRVKGEVWI